MEESTSQLALDLLRRDDKVVWIVDQLVASFSEGIAESAKDHSNSHSFELRAVQTELTPRERLKREKYETSRPYEEEEKLDLIRFALQQVFVTLPAIEVASAKTLRLFGADATSIEFHAPDEEERADRSYAHTLKPDEKRAKELRARFEKFSTNLSE